MTGPQNRDARAVEGDERRWPWGEGFDEIRVLRVQLGEPGDLALLVRQKGVQVSEERVGIASKGLSDAGLATQGRLEREHRPRVGHELRGVRVLVRVPERRRLPEVVVGPRRVALLERSVRRVKLRLDRALLLLQHVGGVAKRVHLRLVRVR